MLGTVTGVGGPACAKEHSGDCRRPAGTSGPVAGPAGGALWTLAMLGIAASLWWDHLLRQAARADLVQSNAIGLAFLLGW